MGWGLLIFGWLLAGSSASAQEEAWIVVVATVGGEQTAAVDRVAASAQDHLRQRRRTVVSGASLQERLARSLSVPFAPATPSLQQRVVSAVDPALTLTATGEYVQAIALVDPILHDAEAALPALNRDDATMHALANLCLLGVRSELGQNRRAEAQQRAARCYQLSPDVDPGRLLYRTTPMHPASVVGLARDARAVANGTLVVDAPSAEGRTCTTRVQGRPLGGSLPVRLQVPHGTYAVQVECTTEPARVHTVQVREAPSTVVVDIGLDEALRGSEPLRLVYTSATARSDQLDGHAALLAARLGVSDLLLVTTAGASEVRVVRWRSSTTDAPEQALPLDATDRVPAAIDALLGRGAPPVSLRSRPSHDDAEGGTSLVGPIALLAAGVVALSVAGYGLMAEGECLTEDSGRCSERQQFTPAMWVWLAGGLVAAATGGIWLALSVGGAAEGDQTALRVSVRGTL